MTVFWLCAIPLAFLAALVIALPLLRPLREDEHSLQSLNAQVFRERLGELEKDRTEGRVDTETFDALKTELERNLLLVADAAQPAVHRAQSRLMFWGLLGLLPLAAVAFYALVQLNPELPSWWKSERDMAPVVDSILAGKQPPADADKHSLPEFIRGLQVHLQATPNDAEGWFYLGISYMQLNMGDQALQAFDRAWSLDPKRSDIALGYAQAMIFTNNGVLTPQSRKLLQIVLAENPHHEGALILLGMGAYRSGDYATAIGAFDELKHLRAGHSDPNSEATIEIDRLLADARQKQASGITAVAGNAGAVEVSVTLDRALATKLRPQDTVFVFAKAMNGPPMPLAVVRKSASELPFTVELNDSQAMMPTMKLSSVQEVVISARVSHSGTVEPQAGDLEAVAVPLRQDGKPHKVELLIREERQ